MRRNRRSNNRPTKRQPGPNSVGIGPARSAIMTQPRLKPVVTFTRKVEKTFDIACNGIAANVGSFYFTLDMLPDYTDFTNLFQSYRIKKVKIEWKPEYTELTDAALVSNAVNVNFNTAINTSSNLGPSAVSDVTQYESCKSTGITKQHSRTLTPAILMNSAMPCSCYVTSDAPSEKHFSIWYGIPATGVTMTFRSVATFVVECAGAR